MVRQGFRLQFDRHDYLAVPHSSAWCPTSAPFDARRDLDPLLLPPLFRPTQLWG